jgi:hypothetical protein
MKKLEILVLGDIRFRQPDVSYLKPYDAVQDSACRFGQFCHGKPQATTDAFDGFYPNA